jgi:hypothetical protein
MSFYILFLTLTTPTISRVVKSEKLLFVGQAKLLSNPVYARRVNSLLLVCSLSSHRHSYIPLIFGSRFIDS